MDQAFIKDVQTKFDRSQELFNAQMEEHDCVAILDLRLVYPKDGSEPIALCNMDVALEPTEEGIKLFIKYILSEVNKLAN